MGLAGEVLNDGDGVLLRVGGNEDDFSVVILGIAAGAFAQTLLDLPCHPRVLDLMALDAISAGRMATRMASRIAAARISDL